MPPFLQIVLDKFVDSYYQEKKNIRYDRDAILNLCLYFSCVMDNEIKTKRNPNEIKKYKNLKMYGLDYIKYNKKTITNYLNLQTR